MNRSITKIAAAALLGSTSLVSEREVSVDGGPAPLYGSLLLLENR